MTRPRPVLTVLIAAGLLAPAGAGAVDARTATDLYRDIRAAERVSPGWTGDAGRCAVGKESKRSVAATLKTVNALRRIAGLKPVRFSAALNRKALAAALMVRASGTISHSPDRSTPCYTAAGADGAATSSLILGRSGAAAVLAYLDDAGVPSLGHRRWLLDPRARRWGTGSTGASNALLVAGRSSRSGSGRVPRVVSWPPAGSVPWPLVHSVWSAGFANRGTDLSSATVRVEVDGDPRPVTAVSDLGPGFGEGTALSWRVGLTGSDRTKGRRISVRISYGRSKTFSYTVDAVAIGR